MGAESVAKFRNGLDKQTLEIVDALRGIIAGAHDGLTEHIKWNAPSFMLGGEDRITLGIERKGGVRVVLHRGAKPKDMANFKFSDPNGLARWPAPDRGVLIFRYSDQIEQFREQLAELCRRWLAATA